MIEDALVTHAEAVSIRVEVVPGSKRSGISGFDDWRKRVKVSLRAAPRGGAANKELLMLVSELLAVERDRVRITEGLRSTRKTVTVEGIAAGEALRALRGVLR